MNWLYDQAPRVLRTIEILVDEVKDTIPHLIFTVTDINATVAALKAAGGKMESEPKEFGKTGIMIGIAVDPAGNRIEMIQQARKK